MRLSFPTVEVGCPFSQTSCGTCFLLGTAKGFPRSAKACFWFGFYRGQGSSYRKFYRKLAKYPQKSGVSYIISCSLFLRFRLLFLWIGLPSGKTGHIFLEHRNQATDATEGPRIGSRQSQAEPRTTRRHFFSSWSFPSPGKLTRCPSLPFLVGVPGKKGPL